MDEKVRKETKEKKHKREEVDQPLVLPGIHRIQFFTNVSDRALTMNLNRLAMLGLATTLGVDVVKPLFHSMPQTVYCYECRACYATQDNCPVYNQFQAELVVSSRVLDYERFIMNGGIKCIRCGACQGFCVQHLDLAKIFGTMQKITMKAIGKGLVPRRVLVNALREGLVNRDFIDTVASAVPDAFV